MTELPRIFDDKGRFIEPPTDGLDEQTLARLAGVRATYGNLKATESAEQAALATINETTQALADLEAYAAKHHPPSTFLDEWRANFGPQLRHG